MAKNRSMLILLSAVLLLGLYIWIQEVWRARVPSKETRRVRLFELDPQTLVLLQFVHTNNVVVECVKENGVWMAGGSGRGAGRADVALVHELIARINSMGKGTTITAEHLEMRGLDADEYGFGEQVMEISAIDNKGRHSWQIGRRTPLGDMVYVKESGGNDIYTVLDMLLTLIPESPDDLRERSLFAGDPAGVRRIEIRGSEGFVQILRDLRLGWQIQQPIAVAADPEAVHELLRRLYTLRILKFEAENVSDFSVYGLQEERRQISLEGSHGASRMLVIGDEIADRPGCVYARRADDTTVFSLTNSVMQLLDIGHNDFRDPRVVMLPWNEVSSISFSRGDEQLELSVDESGLWAISKPVMWEADPRAVHDMIRLWDVAVITEFEITNAPAVPPEWTLEIGSTSLGQTNRIDIFPTFGDLSGLYIKREGDPAVYQINLPAVPDDLLDPLKFKNALIWAIPAEEIQKISLERPDHSEQVVERQADGTFNPVATNGSVRVDHERMERVLDQLCVFSVSEYVTYNPRDLSIYGLTKPSMVLYMGLSGTNHLGKVLLVGEEAAEGYYAMVKGQDVVFLLNKPLVESLSDGLILDQAEAVPAAD